MQKAKSFDVQKCYLFNMKVLLFCLSFLFWLTLGPPFPKVLWSFSILEMHGDVYVFGGKSGTTSSAFDSQSLIYKLSCSSGLCSWTTLSQELKVARHSMVAIPVPDHFCHVLSDD